MFPSSKHLEVVLTLVKDPQGPLLPGNSTLPTRVSFGNQLPASPCPPLAGTRRARPRPRDPESHGGSDGRSPLRACSGRPLLLHREPRPGALPAAGGADAAEGHAGESASTRARAGSKAPPRRVRLRSRKMTRRTARSASEPTEATSQPSEFYWRINIQCAVVYSV